LKNIILKCAENLSLRETACYFIGTAGPARPFEASQSVCRQGASRLGKKIILATSARRNGKINRAAKFNGFAAQEMRDTPLE
jgi:hypothetical protein